MSRVTSASAGATLSTEECLERPQAQQSTTSEGQNRRSSKTNAALASTDREALKARILATSTPDPTGCRIWTGGKSSEKYGYMRVNGVGVRAHRAAFYAWNGYLPPVVRHFVCNAPACVSHLCLRAGTTKDNVQDMFDHGRNADFRGEKNGQAKLSTEQVQKIHEMLALGELNQRQIADQFGVNKTTISRIHRGKRWQHLKTG